MGEIKKITLSKAREKYGIAQSTIRRQIDKFKSLEKVGHMWVISEEELKDWAEKRKERESKRKSNTK
jgi:DeoR/GlpR family transcriptional regulator of sugar metabolism